VQTGIRHDVSKIKKPIIGISKYFFLLKSSDLSLRILKAAIAAYTLTTKDKIKDNDDEVTKKPLL
jgi:hypothetical protein